MKCDFTFGNDGPHCQKEKGHDGAHIWNSGEAMKRKGIKPGGERLFPEEPKEQKAMLS